MNSKWTKFINSFANRTSFNKLSELSTGILYGGDITSTYITNTIDVEGGLGQILINEDNCEYLREVIWSTDLGYEITDVGIYQYTVIYVDRSGRILQKKSMLTNEELRTNILLGVVFHVDNIKVNQIINQKTVPLNTSERVIAFLRKLGLMRIDGLFVEANTGLKVDRSEGNTFGLGVNYYSGSTDVDELYLSGETNCNIVYVYRDGAGGFIYDNNGGSFYIVVDPNFYDDGSGALSIVGGTRWSIQRCYLFPENPSELVIYYGQTRYTSYDEARASLEFEVFEEDEISKRNAVFLGYIIIKNGAIDLSDPNDCKILQSGFIRNLPIGGGGGGGGSAIDTFVTGFTYDPLNNEFTISRNQGEPDLTATINSVNGFTVNGNLDVTGVTTVDSLSANSISGTTYLNLPVNYGSFGITIDGGGAVITTGNKGYLVIPYAGTITGWQIISDLNGSCVIDVWKASSGNIPTIANAIAGTEKPTLSSQQINSDLTLTTWTTAVSQNDVIAFNVDSASTVTRVNLTIFITKS